MAIKYFRPYLLFFVFSSSVLCAQHERHEMIKNTDRCEDPMPPMGHALSLNLPMSRNGSGTSWLPDHTPVFGHMIHTKKWMFMLHENIFLRYNNQDITNKGSRGNKKWDAPNWLMAMGQRKIGRNGLFHFNAMFSFDDVITGGSGYPLLFQTGETFEGRLLVDRQHPHDLFSELSVSYSHAIGPKIDAYVYLGYPGEPALGSVVFMHRVSAMYNPDAPLSHHWNDATHITFGVATIGIRYDKFKIEGSSFTGREPNENRYDFDNPRFDSYSGRIFFNPNNSWSFQVSQGFIKSPEAIHPSQNVNRSTASVIYSFPLKTNRFLSATALWGLNSSETNENIVLLEAVLAMKELAIYSRYERVEKSAEELDLHQFINGTVPIFLINVLTLGFSYDVIHTKFLNMAIGVQGSYFLADKRLDTIYGKNPMSAEAYIRIYPPQIQ